MQTKEFTIDGKKNNNKKLQDNISQFQGLGSCKSHRIVNSFEHGVNNFENNCQNALVDIYFDLGRPKEKGLKWKKRIT